VSSHYNLLVTKKINVKTLVYSKKVLSILQVLYRSGVISNYYLYKTPNKNDNHLLLAKSYIKFTVFIYKQTPFFKKINSVSTPSKLFFISCKTLILTKNIFKSSLIILSTPYGLLTNKEAIAMNTGGKLIYILS